MWFVCTAAVLAGVAAPVRAEPTAKVAAVARITDRSGGSDAAGTAAVKWGFMCSIIARHKDRLFAVDFTRPPDVAWDVTMPNEAPVAFHARQSDGSWSSLLLDSPKRTYQTPTLLLGPDGRANVFTLAAGGDTLYWHQAASPDNAAFVRHDIAMDWGAYLGGAIDEKGRALLVYWGNGAPVPGTAGFDGMVSGYKKSTIGFTLVDTKKGTWKNGAIDSPGAPYCYSQVAMTRSGAHVFTARSEVKYPELMGTRNHYEELRYYYSPDPARAAPWQKTVVQLDRRGLFQPVSVEVDPDGRVHLLYLYRWQNPDGVIPPQRLVYAVSRDPVSADRPADFVHHTLRENYEDGRLFQTRSGKIGVLSYKTGTKAEWRWVTDGVAGKFTDWAPWEMTVSQCRLFPIARRGGSTLTENVEGLFVGAPNAPEKSSLFHFQLGSRELRP